MTNPNQVEAGPKVVAAWFHDGGIDIGGVAGTKTQLRVMSEKEKKAAPAIKAFEQSLEMSLHKSLAFLVLRYQVRDSKLETWVPREHIKQLEIAPN